MKRSFTLVELIALVLIVMIFAVFASSLMGPHRSREKARRACCAGNLKQIGLAMLSYSADYDGGFPMTPDGNNFEFLDEDHSNDLPNSKVYGCPSAVSSSSLSAQSNYWYSGSGVRDDVKDAEHVMLAYDMFGNHPKNKWMNVLFVDGHVNGAKPDGSKGWNDNRHAVYPNNVDDPGL